MWIYRNKEVLDVPKEYIGFVYLIRNKLDDKIYIGKKIFEFTRKKRLTKKEKLLDENKRKRFKYVAEDSKWKVYYGSSKRLLDDIKKLGEENFERRILCMCKSKKELTYKEVYYQFKYNVLEIDSYNDNIMSKFFREKTK